MKMKGFSISGGNGTFTQLEDDSGNIHTYDGVDAPGHDPEGVQDMEAREENDGRFIQWQSEPLAGTMTAEEMQEYVGA
jgi:hypothetical protein